MGEGNGAEDGIVRRSVVIETRQDHAMALERLRRRDPEALAAFILSLSKRAGGGRFLRCSRAVEDPDFIGGH